MVCPTCNGKGVHVNPSIDAHGISPEEFDEDPDFYRDYMKGVFDAQCYGCAGIRVVPIPNEDTDIGRRVIAKMQDQAEWAREEAEALRRGY